MKTSFFTSALIVAGLLATHQASLAETKTHCGDWDFFCLQPIEATTLPTVAPFLTTTGVTSMKRVAQVVEADAIDYVKNRTQTPSPRLVEAITSFRSEAQRRCEASVDNLSDRDVTWAIIRAARADDSQAAQTQH